MVVYLLVIWTGTHQGYITVPNIKDDVSCHRLYTDIKKQSGVGWTFDYSHSCVPYLAGENAK